MATLLYLGTNGHVLALDPATGEKVWRQAVAPGLLGNVRADVCVLEHAGTVYAGCHGEVSALDGRTGEVLWRNGLQGLGYNDVTLCIAGKSVQYVASASKSST